MAGPPLAYSFDRERHPRFFPGTRADKAGRVGGLRASAFLFALASHSAFGARLALAAEASAPPPITHAPTDNRAEAPRFGSLFDELATPRLPRPLHSPELSHPKNDVSVDWLLAAVVPENAEKSTRYVAIVRPAFELRLGSLRRFYVGGTMPIISALPLYGERPSKTIVGNIEGHVRLVFPMPSWLAFGATLGMDLPTSPMKRGSESAAVAASGASLEPAELPQFLPHAFAIRPSFDFRLLRGPLVVQVRDGFDVLIDSTGQTRTSTTGRILAHAGLLLVNDVEVAIEGTQLYYFASDTPDADRTATTLGPTIRWSLPDVDLGIATSTNVNTPQENGTNRFWALRLSAVFHL